MGPCRCAPFIAFLCAVMAVYLACFLVLESNTISIGWLSTIYGSCVACLAARLRLDKMSDQQRARLFFGRFLIAINTTI